MVWKSFTEEEIPIKVVSVRNWENVRENRAESKWRKKAGDKSFYQGHG